MASIGATLARLITAPNAVDAAEDLADRPRALRAACERLGLHPTTGTAAAVAVVCHVRVLTRPEVAGLCDALGVPVPAEAYALAF